MHYDKFWKLASKIRINDHMIRYQHIYTGSDDLLLLCLAANKDMYIVLEVFRRVRSNRSMQLRTPKLESKYQHIKLHEASYFA